MESFEKLVIDFNGHLEIAKGDLVVKEINEQGILVTVNIKDIDSNTIIKNVKEGTWYVSLEDNIQHTLDGETIVELYNGDEDDGE